MGCCWNGVGIQKVLLGICCSFWDEHSTVSQFSRSCDVLLTHSGLEITLWCGFFVLFFRWFGGGFFFFFTEVCGKLL